MLIYNWILKTVGRTKRLSVRHILCCVGVALILGNISPAFGDDAPAAADEAAWRNPDKPTADRVAALMSQLTEKEKISLLYWLAPSIDRLHIPSYEHGNSALHGVEFPRPFTVFPHSIGQGATFDPELIHEMATAISDEARAEWNVAGGQHPTLPKGGKWNKYADVLTLWDPNLNLARDPRWGRTEETYGEDPWLASRDGVAFVKGLQGDDPHYFKTIATPKHFAAYDQESGRKGLNVTVGERYLREYDFFPIHAAMTEGQAESIMGSYTAINRVPCCANKWLLTDVLRGEWGFQGYVVSDCGAISNVVTDHHYVKTPEEGVAACWNAGIDLEGGYFAKWKDMVDPFMPVALQKGLLKQEVVDHALALVLTGRFKLGMYDPANRVPFSKIPESVIGSPEHVALARKIAVESMVLLKNNQVGGGALLPIDPARVKKIVVVGPHMDEAQLGNYSGTPTITAVTPFAGLSKRGQQAGMTVTEIPWNDKAAPASDPLYASLKDADLVIAVAGLSSHTSLERGIDNENEARDRTTIALPPDQAEFLRQVTEQNPKTVLVLEGGSAVALDPALDQAIPSIVEAWYPGEEGGDAIADILFGDSNPAGRLPLTFYASDAQLRPMNEYDLTKGRTYMYLADKPAYAFGHGLSYTAFKYSNLKLSKSVASDHDQVTATVDVTNTGARDGDEVVQAYVHAQKASVPMPQRQLWSFQRVSISKGQTKTVSLPMDTQNFGYWNQDQKKFVVEPGKFDIEVGAASDDIRTGAVLEISK